MEDKLFFRGLKTINQREIRILKTMITSLLSQAIVMLVPMISIRFSLEYLGNEIYGLWMTATAFFSMINFADFGLGNGLQTELSRANNIESKEKIIVSTYSILSLITILLLLATLIVIPKLNWNEILNFRSNTDVTLKIVLAIIIPKLVGVPFSLIRRIQNSLQLGYITNIWQIFGSIFSLFLLIMSVKMDFGKMLIILIPSLVSILVDIFNSVYFFIFVDKRIKINKKNIDWKISYSILKIGMMYFVLSVIMALGLNMDNFIVAKISDVSKVASYSIILRVTQLINIAVIVLSQPLWTANGEALINGEIEWVKKNTLRISKIGTIMCISISLFVLFFYKKIFILWLGRDLEVSIIAVLGMLGIQIFMAFISPYFMVLNGAKKIKIQLVLFSLYMVIGIACKFFIGFKYGINYISVVSAICYLFFIVIPIKCYIKKLYKEIEKDVSGESIINNRWNGIIWKHGLKRIFKY